MKVGLTGGVVVGAAGLLLRSKFPERGIDGHSIKHVQDGGLGKGGLRRAKSKLPILEGTIGNAQAARGFGLADAESLARFP
jgi:hypothetical protein